MQVFHFHSFLVEMLPFGNIDAEDERAAGQVTSVLPTLMWNVPQVSLKASISGKVLNKIIGNMEMHCVYSY